LFFFLTGIQLDLPEAAVGILLYARQHHDIELKESWYEKLQRWEAAKEVYERKQKVQPLNMELTLGRMRCLHALAEWEELIRLSEDVWKQADKTTRQAMAPLSAGAAWNLRQWRAMEDYVSVMSDVNVRFLLLR
jgi:FKBP12-rapamycin complex-associated protein